jgi:cardiolipin synthase
LEPARQDGKDITSARRQRLRDLLIGRRRVEELVPPTLGVEAARLCRYPSSLVAGNRVTLLRNADEAYPAMLEAIRAAERSVRLEMYMFEGGEIGQVFAEALEERARAGVSVQVVYDAVGCLGTPAALWERMRAGGVDVREFHPLSLWRRLWSFNVRDHRKLLVVDGRVAFTGGLNISRSYVTTEVQAGWRDTQVRVEGPAALEMDRLFSSTWGYVSGKPARLPSAAPAPAGDQLVGVIGSRLWRQRTAIYCRYLHAIRRARSSIRIANAYFVPPRRVRRALMRAARRGVAVEVIVPEWGDLLSVHFASRRLFDMLLRSGVRIFLWPDAVMHAKTAVIDGLWATVGSFNLDHRSLFHNIEINLTMVGPEIGAGMEAMFAADRERCREVDLFDWRLRSIGERLLERMWYLFRRWL